MIASLSCAELDTAQPQLVLLLLLVTGKKQSQLLLQPAKVGLGLQVGVEFDKKHFSWNGDFS